MGIWLRHTIGITTTAMRFNELSLVERQSVVRSFGQTLRGNTYDHRLSNRRKWVLVISADETYGQNNSAKTFLDNYWIADKREFANDASLTEPVSGWVAVAIEGGDAPIELVENNRYMPEYTLEMIEKEAA